MFFGFEFSVVDLVDLLALPDDPVSTLLDLLEGVGDLSVCVLRVDLALDAGLLVVLLVWLYCLLVVLVDGVLLRCLELVAMRLKGRWQ